MGNSHLRVPALFVAIAAWLTPRRLRAQAAVLAFCLWGVCAADFATPGLLDRAGNIKFQDFLPRYTSARMIVQRRTDQLYDEQVVASDERKIVPQSSALRLPNLYGPQVALLFVPLARIAFLPAGLIWVQISLLIYGVCIYLILNTCSGLAPYSKIAATAAVAFPPLFHLFVRSQLSALVLACFTGAYLAFRAGRAGLAGLALGLLVFKPQFLIAIPLILLLARSWSALAATAASATAQLALAWTCFGTRVMRNYVDNLWHLSRWIGDAELSLAPIQMHSLRSFWSLLVPWPEASLPLYLLSSIAVIAIAAAVWRSSSPLSLRFAVLVLAAVLANPHLFVYDLLALAPALMLVSDCALNDTTNPWCPVVFVLTYLSFLLPLLGPLSRWTHVQLSVPCFFALLWVLWQSSAFSSATSGPKLAWHDSLDV